MSKLNINTTRAGSPNSRVLCASTDDDGRGDDAILTGRGGHFPCALERTIEINYALITSKPSRAAPRVQCEGYVLLRFEQHNCLLIMLGLRCGLQALLAYNGILFANLSITSRANGKFTANSVA